jgi:hypothetical protein
VNDSSYKPVSSSVCGEVDSSHAITLPYGSPLLLVPRPRDCHPYDDTKTFPAAAAAWYRTTPSISGVRVIDSLGSSSSSSSEM